MFILLLSIVYLSFISLGLPDALLGSAWPLMYLDLGVPVSSAGIISLIIALSTVFSSIFSSRLTRRFGSGLVTAISVVITCLAIFSFSFAKSFLFLAIFAVPYGLGAGAVDATLNSYVATHFKRMHMSFLHAMWGIGASLGPIIMGFALSGGNGWRAGYSYIGIIQAFLSILLFLSLPLWKRVAEKEAEDNLIMNDGKTLSRKTFPLFLLVFFSYCAFEQTAGLWGVSYLVMARGVNEITAARCGANFYLGITIGRIVAGFITIKLTDRKMVALGLSIIFIALLLFFTPVPEIALLLLGAGCAPLYPALLHVSPILYGRENSQKVMGLEMATAYMGVCLMPPLFGFIANGKRLNLLPCYLLPFAAIMAIITFILFRKGKAKGLDL